MIEVVLALAVQAGSAKTADTDRGSRLYHECRQVVRLNNNEAMQPNEVDSSSSCLDYLDGFIDAMLIASHAVCPRSATLGTIARVYVAYMEANPKMMDFDKATGLNNALKDNFPWTVLTKKK